MINIYVSNYKDFLKNLFSKMAELHAERERISQQYSADYAKSALAEIDRRASHELKETETKIRKMHNGIIELLSVSSIPTVESLTADRLFFDGSAKIELTPEIVKVFIERYNENPTMLSLIRTWIDTRHKNDTNLYFSEILHFNAGRKSKDLQAVCRFRAFTLRSNFQ